MTHAVKLLSRLQLPQRFVGQVTQPARADSAAAPDVATSLGGNVLKTPH